jgi:hypothetical protein
MVMMNEIDGVSLWKEHVIRMNPSPVQDEKKLEGM